MLRACYRHAANALTVHQRVQMLILTSALLQTGTNLVDHVFTYEQMSRTNPEMDQQMEQERLALLLYAMRKYSCWCLACSCVRGRGPAYGTVSRGSYLDVPNCARKKLTVWKEDRFTVTKEAGIEKRKKRVAEMVAKEVTKAKPGAWGCVQARELWSTEEDVHLRPGHHWIFEFGDAG